MYQRFLLKLFLALLAGIVLINLVNLLGGVAARVAHANAQQRANTAQRGWQKQLAQANLLGKTPPQVFAYLDSHHVSHQDFIASSVSVQPTVGASVSNARYGPVASVTDFSGVHTNWYVVTYFKVDRRLHLISQQSGTSQR